MPHRGLFPYITLVLRLILRIILGVLFVVGLSGCVNPIAFASKHPVSFRYVGTFSLGEPVQTGKSTEVPLIVDYRTGEWMMNSGLVPYGTRARVDDKKITFSVLVSLPPNHGPLELRLPKLAAGNYAAIYVDPDGTQHPAGSITIR